MVRREFSYRGCGSMPRTLFAAAVVGLVLAAPAQARPVPVMPNVTYDHTVQWTPHGPLSLYVITAPRPGGLYSLNALLSNGTITGRETVTSMERDVSPRMTTIGVNGDFFNWNGGWPSGLLMQGGVVEHHAAEGPHVPLAELVGDQLQQGADDVGVVLLVPQPGQLAVVVGQVDQPALFRPRLERGRAGVPYRICSRMRPRAERSRSASRSSRAGRRSRTP